MQVQPVFRRQTPKARCVLTASLTSIIDEKQSKWNYVLFCRTIFFNCKDINIWFSQEPKAIYQLHALYFFEDTLDYNYDIHS